MTTRRRLEISSRKQPQQARSTELVAAILQAAVEVLAQEGATRFTTARVAERAGVSVGLLGATALFSGRQHILDFTGGEMQHQALLDAHRIFFRQARVAQPGLSGLGGLQQPQHAKQLALARRVLQEHQSLGQGPLALWQPGLHLRSRQARIGIRGGDLVRGQLLPVRQGDLDRAQQLHRAWLSSDLLQLAQVVCGFGAPWCWPVWLAA